MGDRFPAIEINKSINLLNRPALKSIRKPRDDENIPIPKPDYCRLSMKIRLWKVCLLIKSQSSILAKETDD
jgi:hypothetical protein